jgi:DNA-binding GntR family transcriptional regulator
MTTTRATSDPLSILRSQTLTSAVQRQIEQLILSGEIAAGDRINELSLAQRLGVSRGPIREACRGLCQAGLLTTQVNRGFFVRKLSLKEVADVYELRAALMRLAGRLVAERINAPQLARLRTLIAEMEAAADRNDGISFLELNSEFHDALVEYTDNQRLMEMYRGLVKELQLYRKRGLVDSSGRHASNLEHRAIIDAVAAHDAARAAAAMEHHIMQGKARFIAAVGDQID